MATHELRPMGIGDILDTTFRLYRQRFFTFLLIALIVYVPYALMMTLFQPFQTPRGPAIQQQTALHRSQIEPAANPAGAILTGLGSIVFGLILFPLCSAALVHNISATYLGKDLTAGQSYSRTAPRLLGLVGTQFLVGITIMLGFLLLIVPGVIFSLWFLVVVPVVILENKGGTKALGRSRELMRGNVDKGFMLALCVGILGIIIGIALGTLQALVPWPHPVIGVFVSTVCQAIILPIQTAPWILLYYDLRIRKEAFDLERLTEALGQDAPI